MVIVICHYRKIAGTTFELFCITTRGMPWYVDWNLSCRKSLVKGNNLVFLSGAETNSSLWAAETACLMGECVSVTS